jgi:hypothetical protein
MVGVISPHSPDDLENYRKAAAMAANATAPDVSEGGLLGIAGLSTVTSTHHYTDAVGTMMSTDAGESVLGTSIHTSATPSSISGVVVSSTTSSAAAPTETKKSTGSRISVAKSSFAIWAIRVLVGGF